uniref:Uncharacterized protein n=1 Tax=Euplotes crassus TaxID=5936 RepID=A0A7S3KNW8_EUPCR|mmetsp:Transcript_37581/g.37135  ORF Transcript_37581/g.37135 Transcript_37581/m.37135 type:complete len:151 (+) Transcript_37581:2-454(+)
MNFPIFDENLSEEFIDENVSASSVNTSPNLEKNMTGNQFHFSYEMTRKLKAQPCLKANTRSSFPSMDDAVLETQKHPIFKKYNRPRRIIKKKTEIKGLSHPITKVENLPKRVSESKGYMKKSEVLTQKVSSNFKRTVTMSDIDAPGCFET